VTLYSEGTRGFTHNTVLLLVAGHMALSWQLAPLPDGHKGGTQSGGDQRSEEEPTGVETDDDVHLVSVLGQGLGKEVVHEMGHEGFGRDGVPEDGLRDVNDRLSTSILKRKLKRALETHEDVQEGDSLSDNSSTFTPRSAEHSLIILKLAGSPPWGTQGRHPACS
jgi:hypothetical protein